VTGLKPQGSMTFAKVTATVKTIAEWVPVTKRALSDAGQLRGIIDQQLRADLQSELEDQVMNGTNTGDDLEGLENTPGTLSQAFVTDLFTTTRRAKTFAMTAEEDGGGGFEPTAYVFNPEDWEAIELTQDGNQRYYGEGPFRNTPKTLWGIPVVESPKTRQGKGWLGKWTDYVVWDREQASISVSDSPYEFFVRNLVAVLSELRAAGAAIRPKSFIEIDLQTGS
jgi:HK97 family phage major capsid protein